MFPVWQTRNMRPLRLPTQVRSLSQAATPKSSRRVQWLVAGLAITATTAGIYYVYTKPKSQHMRTSYVQPMHPSHFTPTILSSSIPSPSDPTSKLIELTIPPSLLPKDYEDLSAVWSICIKDDDIQTERPYTPLDGIDKQGKLRLWIRRYPDGEVGRWIHGRPVGKKIEVRGPLQTIDMKAEEGKWDHIIMVFRPFSTAKAV